MDITNPLSELTLLSAMTGRKKVAMIGGRWVQPFLRTERLPLEHVLNITSEMRPVKKVVGQDKKMYQSKRDGALLGDFRCLR